MTSQTLEETESLAGEGRKATESAHDPAPMGDAEVAAFLESDTEFFLRHPDLTAELRLPHGPNGTVSLVEHQLAVLRSQLDTERRRLTHLIARAREYETLSARLHTLVLQLIVAPDLGRIQAALRESLCKEFDAEAVTLKLFPVAEDAPTSDPLVAAFLEFVDREHALCGPLDEARSNALFGDDSDKIHSAALIPIRGELRAGVLAIGSSDPKRFTAEMGTDHLDRLGEVVSRRLGIISHEDD
jgi:uncharacterized protein YigA (DUF484 family)